MDFKSCIVATLTKEVEQDPERYEDMLYSFKNFTLKDVLPGIKTVTSYTDANICRYGEYCTYFETTLYAYQEYYIIFEVYEEGNDLNVTQYTNSFDSLEDFLEECLTVIKKDDFDETLYLNVHFRRGNYISYFKHAYGEEQGKLRFLAFMSQKYEESSD